MKSPLLYYLQSSFRGILKNKLSSGLNIFGLAIGIATALLLAQYVVFEYSYDRFHINAENLYRIPLSYTSTKEFSGSLAMNHPTVGPAMKKDFPEVQNFCRIVHPGIFVGNVAIKYTDESGQVKSFREESIYFADSSVFTMFSFPLLKGDATSALAAPNSIALSASAAERYFGNEEPMGKSLYFMGVMPLKVKAIFSDIPENSHIQFDILISYLTIWRPSAFNSWKYPQFYNYVQLRPGTDATKFESKFPAFIEKYLGDINREFGFQNQFTLQPITDIHLKSNCLNEPRAQGNEQTVRFLALLAIFILAIAWINYINLTMARSLKRAREAGLRKIIGAKRSNLTLQFLTDSLIVNILATLLGVILVILVWPWFVQLAANNMNENIFRSVILKTPQFIWILLTILMIGSLISGLYPAIKLSSFQPVEVIKGNFFGSSMGIRLRKMLVLFQFIITTLLIAGTLVVRKQLIYMADKDLGFRKDQVIVIKSPAIYDSTTYNRTMHFQAELLRLPEVISSANSSEIPGHPIESGNTFRRINQKVEEEDLTKMIAVDNTFFDTYNIPILEGRYFSESDSTMIYGGESNVVLLNRKATEVLGFNEPAQIIGEYIYFRLGPGSHKAEVIGVVENYHQRSPREDFDPILFFYQTAFNGKYLSIQVKPVELDKTIRLIGELYGELLPDNPFDYFFLDTYFDQQYRAENQFEKIFGAFAMLALLVACLGLYGLSSFMVNQRYKEIGIRKVLGSSLLQILMLLYKDFSMLIIISFVLTGPFIYWLGNKWLSNFTFHTGISWPIFVLPLLILIFITIITSIVQTLRASLENPAHALRY